MARNESSVNYIKHLSEIFVKFSEDDRLSAYHISLYIALFQMWNINRFSNPLLIIRSEIMQVSRISSKSTYHRCIKELEAFGYIEYFPSRNAMVGSKINIKPFGIGKISSPLNGHQKKQPSPILGHQNGQPSPIYGHPNEPFIKQINKNKHTNLFMAQNEFCATIKNEKPVKKSSSSKEALNPKFTPPNLEFVQDYFKEKKKPDIEAQKFFYHFESNGWKIGGRSPMKNWKAAANNWMLNSDKFNPVVHQPKPDNLHVNTDKDYSIPL